MAITRKRADDVRRSGAGWAAGAVGLAMLSFAALSAAEDDEEMRSRPAAAGSEEPDRSSATTSSAPSATPAQRPEGDPCRASRACKSTGRCVSKGKQCVAVSQADCDAATACSHGKCQIDGTRGLCLGETILSTNTKPDRADTLHPLIFLGGTFLGAALVGAAVAWVTSFADKPGEPLEEASLVGYGVMGGAGVPGTVLLIVGLSLPDRPRRVVLVPSGGPQGGGLGLRWSF